jgi:hypothetical protein
MADTSNLPTMADFTCPGCGGVIPESYRELWERVCPNCGKYTYHSGLCRMLCSIPGSPLSKPISMGLKRMFGPEWHPAQTVPPATPKPGAAEHSREVTEFLPTSADITILTVLSVAVRAFRYTDIVMRAAELQRKERRKDLITVSESVVRERVPILEKKLLVTRPQGRDGRPSKRRGIGITDRGRALLKAVQI